MSVPVRIDHVVIHVSDWDRSNSFYTRVLGAELIEQDRGRVSYRLGDQQLNVHGPGSDPQPVAANPGRPGSADLCFVWTGTPQRAVEHLEAQGVEVIDGPVPRRGGRDQGTSVYFRDPDGALLEFIYYE